jgi:hypothetical protein
MIDTSTRAFILALSNSSHLPTSVCSARMSDRIPTPIFVSESSAMQMGPPPIDRPSHATEGAQLLIVLASLPFVPQRDIRGGRGRHCAVKASTRG